MQIGPSLRSTRILGEVGNDSRPRTNWVTGCETAIKSDSPVRMLCFVLNADRAIITVNADSRRGRQRFSAAHELGHWMRDRNQVGFSCTNALFRSQWGGVNPERGANEFAADLLLPQTIFGRY